jgi:hypothetical protein
VDQRTIHITEQLLLRSLVFEVVAPIVGAGLRGVRIRASHICNDLGNNDKKRETRSRNVLTAPWTTNAEPTKATRMALIENMMTMVVKNLVVVLRTWFGGREGK